MTTTIDLVQVLKRELKQADFTYADLAQQLGMSESSVKRMLSRGDLSLKRVDEILRVLKLDLADIARTIAAEQVLPEELTHVQEKAVVADRKLLLVAICCQSQWTFQQIVDAYLFTPPEAVRCMTRLDRIGLIELRPNNRYTLKLAKTFRWRPQGPVMQYFRDHAMADYFGGGFDGPGEAMTLVHGAIGRSAAPAFADRLQRLAQDFSRQHLADQRLPESQREAYTLVLAMRSWLFAAFRDLKRPPAESDSAGAMSTTVRRIRDGVGQ